MKVLVGGSWEDGYLDYCRRREFVRLWPKAWRVLARVDGMYFVRRRELRILANYMMELGLVEVLRKVRSRGREIARNEKYVSVGYARVLESGHARFEPGTCVVFLAPAHPACVERISLPAELMRIVDPSRIPASEDAAILWAEQGKETSRWNALAGWDPESSSALPNLANAFDLAERLLASTDWVRARRLPTAATEPTERTAPREGPAGKGGRPSATLVGYGNYAKTQILPNMAPYVRVARIHELDPLQIPAGRTRDGLACDTSPYLRSDDDARVFLVAGYHHTHAPIAVDALRRGSYAAVEKPLATTAEQLDDLVDAVRAHPRLFACFQRRYMRFNDWVRRDLEVANGAPISCHAVVFEVPLPPRHWYRWPSSGSRLLSNGCHWIDHFLWLNDWARPSSWHAARMADGTVNCTVELVNGAVFTMVLTERGSDRLGLRDHVELRTVAGTVTIDDASRYVAENRRRVLRRARVNKVESYRRMYRSIGARIVAGSPGDSLESIEVSARLVLSLEDSLIAAQPQPEQDRANAHRP